MTKDKRARRAFEQEDEMSKDKFDLDKTELPPCGSKEQDEHIRAFNDWNGGRVYDFDTFRKYWERLREEGIEEQKLDECKAALRSAFEVAYHDRYKADLERPRGENYFHKAIVNAFLSYAQEQQNKRHNRFVKSTEIVLFAICAFAASLALHALLVIRPECPQAGACRMTLIEHAVWALILSAVFGLVSLLLLLKYIASKFRLKTFGEHAMTLLAFLLAVAAASVSAWLLAL